MLEEIKRKAKLWQERYHELVGVAMINGYSRYKIGVRDGIDNSAIPAFMGGYQSTMKTLINKVGYENAPEPYKKILAMFAVDENNVKVIQCYTDGNRNLVADGNIEGNMTHWINMDDLVEWIFKKTDNDKKEGE